MRRRYRVEGTVQGVGFRYFVLRSARRLGLSGWVRNCEDGSVEAEAAGSADRLLEFEAELRQGPPFASVTCLQVTDASDEVNLSNSFEIA